VAQGIHYKLDLDGGIWTAVEALNAALGLLPPEREDVDVADLI
jgi:hypothetical protein